MTKLAALFAAANKAARTQKPARKVSARNARRLGMQTTREAQAPRMYAPQV